LIPPLENWNGWINIANGDLVTFLPDDDKLAPEFIEKSVKEFADKDTVLVKSGCFVINGESEITSSYLQFHCCPVNP
jgi:cellulose synthase/poly-beta-1,6-N-acetylglucosamine synthase-like glycosyltransferase